jgi:hypothetical protein
MKEQKTKPKHNEYDNIWEIRQSGYPTDEQIKEILEKPYVGTDISGSEVQGIGKGLIYRNAESFIQTVIRKKSIHLPVWKILLPGLDDRKVGAVYYIVNCDDYNFAFRGTYGYWGTGPHESALIEAIFESSKLFFEVRDGDFLLNFFEEVGEK